MDLHGPLVATGDMITSGEILEFSMMQEQPLKFYKTKSHTMITKKTLLTDTKTRNSTIDVVNASVLSYSVNT